MKLTLKTILMSCANSAAASLILSTPLASAAPISFELMHTRPECSYSGHQPTWCQQEDSKTVAALSGMEAKVGAMLELAQDPATARITIAYFSFSNRSVFNKLCERGKAGIPIEGYFDVSYQGGTQMPERLRNECQGPSGKNVRVSFLGQKDTSDPSNIIWRLHHNKFLLIEPGNGADVKLNFSSGNLSSSGLSIHFDHWVTITASPESNAVKMQKCVVKALRDAVDPKLTGQSSTDDPYVYRQSLESCLASEKTLWKQGTAWIEKAIESERVAPLFAPDPNNNIYRALVDHINRVAKGGSIRGAMQHFLHAGIADALTRAVDRGVDVQLLMDNDVVAGGSEVPGVQEFFEAYLDPSVSGMKIQFMETNSGVMQMMHNKYLILKGVDGDKNRVFSGAGHFTTSGLKNNYENFYITQDDALTSRYDDLFGYMWPRSITKKQATK